MNVEPFSVKPTSYFNRIFVDDVVNDVVHGILALIIVVELGNICQTIVYATPTLRKEALDRFLTFNRTRTLSFLHAPITSLCFQKARRRRHVHRRRTTWKGGRSLLSQSAGFLVALALIGCEFMVIIAGTAVYTPITAATTNFDAKLGITQDARRQRDVRPGCDDFFVPARGIQKRGAVYKCVSARSSDLFRAPDVDSFELKTGINDNTHTFSVESRNSLNSTSITLSIIIGTAGQGEQQVAPFRADIDLDYTTTVFRAVVEGSLNRSISGFDKNLTISTVEIGSQTFQYENESFGVPHAQVAAALVSQLRRMDVVLNSTSAPWVFAKARTYETRPDIVVSISASNRVPQVAVIITAVVLIVMRVIVNAHLSSFDDVSYTAMKDIIRDDCLLGPLALNTRAAPIVVPLLSDGCERSGSSEAENRMGCDTNSRAEHDVW